MPTSADARTRRSATGSAPLARAFQDVYFPAHAPQYVEQAGARRIQPDVLYQQASFAAPNKPATMKNAADEKSPGTFRR